MWDKNSLGLDLFLSTRYSVALFFFLIVLSFAGLWAIVNHEYGEEVAATISQLENTTSVTSERISGFLSEPAYLLESLVKEKRVLSHFSPEVNLIQLEEILYSLAVSHPSFNQLRWIDETGQERIRLQRSEGLVTRMPLNTLQNKKDRYYFQQTMQLSYGQIFLSPIDLNVEQGNIEIPYRPTIRIAAPIILPNSDRKGIFVINRDVQEVLNILDRLSRFTRLYLVNLEGYWLTGPDPDRVWGFMFNKDYKLASDSPQAWMAIEQSADGHVQLDDGLWVWSTLRPLSSSRIYKLALEGNSQSYKIISHIPAADLETILQGIWWRYIQIYLLALLIVSIMLLRLRKVELINQQVSLKLQQTEMLRDAESRALSAELESRLLIESSLNGIMTVDKVGYIVMVNPAIERIFQYKKDELLNKPLRTIIPEIETIFARLFQRDNITPIPVLMQGIASDGSTVPLEITLSSYPGQSDTKIVITVADISERLEVEQNNRLMTEVFENTVEGILITDRDFNIVKVNQAFTDITGFEPQQVLGKNPNKLQPGQLDGDNYLDVWENVKSSGYWKGERWNRKKNGEMYPESLTLSQIKNDQGELLYYIAIFSDISEIKQSQHQVNHLANHDPLTDLPNRQLITETIRQTIKLGQRHDNKFAVMLIDLDLFKGINDTYGLIFGDKLLKQVTKSIRSSIRNEDTLARIGGDEFLLLQEDVEEITDAITMAEKILNSFRNPFRIDNIEVRMSASIGISIYPDDGESAEILIKNADTTMHLAKDEGRNNFQFYTKSLTEKARANHRLEHEMRKALDNGEFFAHFQPQVDITTQQLIGLEVLARWDHREMGLIPPAKFIPVAERCGLIIALGESMLVSACQQGKAWLDKGFDFGCISVNVSGAQLKNGTLVDVISHILDETGLPSQYLELEITESYIMEQFCSAIEQLEALRQLGITLSIDDFGTGHSSLSQLKRLPVTKLKIDQSFIRDIPEDLDDIAITEAIIAMSRALKLTTIAEGVEKEEQAEFLIRHGCKLAQGYFYSRPITADKIESKYLIKSRAELHVVRNAGENPD